MNQKVHVLPLLLLLLLSAISLAQSPGGGNLNPGIVSNPESVKAFMDMRLGLSIHWGPSSQGGKEISWSRDKEIPKEEYDNFYKTFNPIYFNAEQWVDLAKTGGMRYIMLTSKHHDGFSLWNSAYSEYDISNTPFKRDIVRELSEACTKKGVVFGSYYSILDWYHPDYHPYNFGGPGTLFQTFEDTPNLERYLVYMKSQLRELILDYGAEIIQLDGEWDSTWNHQLGSDLYLYMRKLNDEVLISSRTDVGRYHLDPLTGTWDWKIYAGDYDERERMVDWVDHETPILGKSEQPWQAWVTIDQAQWSYNKSPRLLSAREVTIDFLKTIGDNGNYLINLGPQPDGKFPAEQAAILEVFGTWVLEHQDGIYGTRGGPFSVEDKYTSTMKDQTIFLYVFDPTVEEIEIKAADLHYKGITTYHGEEVFYRKKGNSLFLKAPLHEEGSILVFKMLLSSQLEFD